MKAMLRFDFLNFDPVISHVTKYSSQISQLTFVLVLLNYASCSNQSFLTIINDMSQLDDKLNSVMILNQKITPRWTGGGGGMLRTPYSCTGYIAITQKYKLGVSRNILMYTSLCPPAWYQMANFGSLAHAL